MDALSKEAENPPECCPACGNTVPLARVNPEGDVPCPRCGTLLWFVHRPLGEGLVLTFLPGLIAASESLARVGEVTSTIGDAPRVVLKLNHLPFLSSTFINMLVALHRREPSESRIFKICGLHPDIREVFKVTQIDSLFDIYDDEQTALKA